jgi:hypothetical protein
MVIPPNIDGTAYAEAGANMSGEGRTRENIPSFIIRYFLGKVNQYRMKKPKIPAKIYPAGETGTLFCR